MPAFFPILETLLKRAFRSWQQLLFRFFFYLLNHSKTLSFYRCLQFWEEDQRKSAGAKSGEYGGWDMITIHAQASMSELLRYPWLVFAQFSAFLMNCFAQSVHNFKVVFLIRTLWQEIMMHHALQSTIAVSKTFKFDRTRRDFFGFDSSGHFHCDDCSLVSISWPYIHISSLVMIFLSKSGSSLNVGNIS